MPILSNIPLAVPINESFILSTDNLDYHLILEKLNLISFRIASLDWAIFKLTETDDFNTYKKYVSINGIIQNRFEVKTVNKVDQIRVFDKLNQLLSVFPNVTVTSEESNGSFYVYLWSDNTDLFVNIQSTIDEIVKEINPAYFVTPSIKVINNNPSILNSVFDFIRERKLKLIEQYSNLCAQLLTTPL